MAKPSLTAAADAIEESLFSPSSSTASASAFASSPRVVFRSGDRETMGGGKRAPFGLAERGSLRRRLSGGREQRSSLAALQVRIASALSPSSGLRLRSALREIALAIRQTDSNRIERDARNGGTKEESKKALLSSRARDRSLSFSAARSTSSLLLSFPLSLVAHRPPPPPLFSQPII